MAGAVATGQVALAMAVTGARQTLDALAVRVSLTEHAAGAR